MRWEVIRHLIKLMWMVYKGRLMLNKIYMDREHWYVDLYTREYYEKMFLIKEEVLNGNG